MKNSSSMTNNEMLMRFLKGLCFFLFFVLGFVSCRNSSSTDGFTISGNIPSLSGQKVLLKELDPREVIPLDSVKAGSNGSFSFNEKSKDAGFYLLQFGNGKALVLVMDKGEKLEVMGDFTPNSGGLRINGSVGTLLLKDFYATANKNKAQVDSLKTLLKNAEGSPDFYTLSLSADFMYQKIAASQKALEKDFINKHKESLASLIVLNYSLGASSVLTMDKDLDYYKGLTALSVKYPNNKHVIYHQQRITVFLANKSKPKFH